MLQHCTPPPRWSPRYSLALRNIFPHTDLGTPLSLSRAACAHLFRRQNSFRADLCHIFTIFRIFNRSLWHHTTLKRKRCHESTSYCKLRILLGANSWKKRSVVFLIFFCFSRSQSRGFPWFLPLRIQFLFQQGFKDTSLSVWDASSILRNYEVRDWACVDSPRTGLWLSGTKPDRQRL